MTNTKFHALPSNWILRTNQVIAPMRLMSAEIAELMERLAEFWTMDNTAMSVSVERSAFNGGADVRVEFTGAARRCTQISDVLFAFYQDVNNDVISND